MAKKRKVITRNPYQKTKKETWTWCSRYIRVRDAVSYAQKYEMPDRAVAQCYTCGKVGGIMNMHAGHYGTRGHGGHSGIYFNEAAIHTQCVKCNTWEQGRQLEFRIHLIKDYGEEVVQRLEGLHKVNKYTLLELFGLKEWFKAQVNNLCAEHNIQKWWK